MKATLTKIPEASNESIVKYDAKWGSCNCPDYAHRGGSYDLGNHETGCKHMARQRGSNPLVGPARVKAQQDYLAKQNPVQVSAPISSDIGWFAFIEIDADPFAAFTN